MLNDVDKTTLLTIARATLESRLFSQAIPECHISSEALLERKGAFVSLHKGEELRGCIGRLYPDRELYKVVQHCILSAAFEDGRFFPVIKDELRDLCIEVSVLSPFHRIRQIEEIEVGKHGLFIAQGQSQGLLLPQVATQYGWDRMMFLIQTCRKSGLPDAAWQDPHTIIHTFEAEVFSEISSGKE
jgi:AmmeMemoRadiSam system protein A